MYRVNVVNQSTSGVSAHSHTQVIAQTQQTQHQQQQHQPLVGVLNQLDAITVSGGNSSAGSGNSNIIVGNGSGTSGSSTGTIVISDETIIAAVKSEPMHDVIATTSSTTTNGHVIYAPMKRARLEG